MLTFRDILKKGFWGNFTLESGELTIARVLLTLAVAFVLGLFIFLIYKKTHRGIVYNRGFNISLVLTALVSSLIIMTISSDLVLSLGMVGALSIVRFRTALKDPLDIVFMFWALAIGITAGATLFETAAIGSAAIGLVIFIMSRVRVKGKKPYLLVLRFDRECDAQVEELLAKLPDYSIRSKSVTKAGVELMCDLALANRDTAFLQDFTAIDGVHDASIVSQQEDNQ